jgi:hypothetical protein
MDGYSRAVAGYACFSGAIHNPNDACCTPGQSGVPTPQFHNDEEIPRLVYVLLRQSCESFGTFVGI